MFISFVHRSKVKILLYNKESKDNKDKTTNESIKNLINSTITAQYKIMLR